MENLESEWQKEKDNRLKKEANIATLESKLEEITSMIEYEKERNNNMKEELQFELEFELKQDLSRKCSAWKEFRLRLEISLHSSLRDWVKWDLGLGVNC